MKSMTKFLNRRGVIIHLVCFFVLFTFPASPNYRLKSYDFGNGGAVADSPNFRLEGQSGEIGAQQASSSSYGVNSGLLFVQQANVPIAPTFQNTGGWYDKLQLILNISGNPTDATYAVAISKDNWATTQYIQTNNTIGSSFDIANFQTYTAWGGGSGAYVIGLQENTTYQIKVKARQGKYTESGWGPVASAVTTSITLGFNIDTAPLDQETDPPYVVNFGALTPGSLATANDKIWVSIDTNANSGAYVYIYDQYGGLRSTARSYTITAQTTDLTGATEGFGIQGNTVGQTSGGPLALVSPYAGDGNNVGVVDSSLREVFSTSGTPIIGGRGSLLLKAKPSNLTPSASDYTDTLTLIAAATF
jgi:hypothetical protein